jgi:hypothetical protein
MARNIYYAKKKGGKRQDTVGKNIHLLLPKHSIACNDDLSGKIDRQREKVSKFVHLLDERLAFDSAVRGRHSKMRKESEYPEAILFLRPPRKQPVK